LQACLSVYLLLLYLKKKYLLLGSLVHFRRHSHRRYVNI
jgi:hypothetical protein